MMHRRLFWKIYLTLLSSLVAVAVLMGAIWWLIGERPQDRWGQFRVRLADQLVTEQESAGVADDAIRRLGDEIGADISLYGPGGTLVASRGLPITDPASATRDRRHNPVFMRIDLPDGRMVLVRLKPPPSLRVFRILTTILIVAGGVGLAAFPMTARLTRQLEGLRSGMARWGGGDLSARVDDRGADEVAAVARAFNAAAERVNSLLTAQRALLANASHELRSPLARLRLAVDLWSDQPTAKGRTEVVQNLAELDGLVEEILLSSRLEHPSSTIGRIERVDLLGLAAEEAARVGAVLDGEPVEIDGNETLLRRMLRNLLENGVKHGRPPVRITVAAVGTDAWIRVSDGGEGIAPAERERIFEPFYRPVGRSEQGGGWGLGLSLVRMIAARHGGHAICDAGSGQGSAFAVRLPMSRDKIQGSAETGGRAMTQSLLREPSPAFRDAEDDPARFKLERAR